MFRTRWIRKLLARDNSLGRRRRQMTKSRRPVRLRLEALEDRVVPDATTVVAGNITLNFFGSNQSPAFVIPVTVNDNSGGTATSGTVTISLTENNTTVVLGSATVGSDGVATVSIDTGTLPSNLQPGTFTLEESFSGSGNFEASSVTAMLTINVATTTVTPVSVSITAANSSQVTESGGATIPIGADASNFVVLFEGVDGHTLHIANSTINGNVGIGDTGKLHLSGPVTINGDVDFAGSGSVKGGDDDNDQGDDDNDQGDDDHGNDDHGHGDDNKHDHDHDHDVGPTAVNVNDAAVTVALNTVNALSASLAGFGTSISINGSGTINESEGTLVTVNGVTFRVFNVKSIHMDEHDVLTVRGDGSGVPVVFNFDGKGTAQLDGDINLTNGLSPDQVLWNFSGSGGKVHLHGDADHSPSLAFEGIILAPNDEIQLDHAHLIGRVFGGDDKDMQINGKSTIDAPSPVTTITTTTTTSFAITVQVTSPTLTVSGGTVTLDLIAGNQTIVLGTATVGSNGMATVTVTDQGILQEIASLPPGSFTLVETFSGSGPFAGSTTTATFTINAQPTTVTVPPVTVTVNNPTIFNITVNVTTPNGPVTSGSVTIDLVLGNQTIPLGTATVGPNGTFTVNVTGSPLQTISNLPPGTFTILVNFNSAPGSPNGSTTTPGTLVIAPPSSIGPSLATTTPSSGPGGGGTTPSTPGLSPIQAALELALEAALLENLNNPGAVGEAELFAQVFLGHTVPTTVPELMQSIQSLVPQAGPMLGPALGFASFLGPDLAIENPM